MTMAAILSISEPCTLAVWAVSIEGARYLLPLAFLAVYLLMRFSSWLAVKRGGQPVSERLMIATPALSFLLLMSVLANPSSYPDRHRTQEEQRQSETNDSLRRDVDRALKESRASRALLEALLHTGWLMALIGICAGPRETSLPKSTP